MPTMNIRPLRDNSNAAIMDAIRAEASPQYFQRIPAATQAGVKDTVEHLHQFRPHMNEFMDALVNRIGTVIARNTVWTNPLSDFKRGMMGFGDTIEEIQTGLLKAHTYDPDRDYLERDIFASETPASESNFHRINRQNFYKITMNEDLLRRAFLEDGGLAGFIGQLMQAPTTSDNWDEFLLTCQLFKEYENNGGFYHVKIPDVASPASTAEDAKSALRTMRGFADTLPFISTKYNAAHMPTFANRDEMLLFATPEFQAAVDVEALAGAFNVSKTDLYGRIVTIPKEQFAIKGCQAIMTTKDFFVIADTLLENRSMQNPVGLGTNYFLHHHSIISASRFVPAVMFSSVKDDSVITIDKPVTGITAITFEPLADGTTPTNVARGGMVGLVAEAVTAGDAKAVSWYVTGGNSQRTYITQQGVLHVGIDETAKSLTVGAVTTWIDPDMTVHTDPKAKTKSVPVVGDIGPAWPDPLDGDPAAEAVTPA